MSEFTELYKAFRDVEDKDTAFWLVLVLLITIDLAVVMGAVWFIIWFLNKAGIF